MKKDALDELFVNCNRLKEGEAKRILTSKKDKDLSLKSWKWDVPTDLMKISQADINRFETFIGLGRWNVSKGRGRKFICIAYRGNSIYLEPEIVRILYNSIKDEVVEE
jgi:hypothetical protein